MDQSARRVLLRRALFVAALAIAALIFYFSGSDTISERLSETIPLEAGFQNSNYFGKNYHGTKAEPEKEIPYLKQTVSTLEALAFEDGVIYCNYQIGMQFYLDRVFPRGVPRKTSFDWATAREIPDDDETEIRGDEWEETGLQLASLSGIRTKDFFAHNNIALLESADTPLTDASAYVPHTAVIREEDGTYRPVHLGDHIEIYDYNVSEPWRLHTCVVEGIYQYYSKFDYSYGKDPSYIGLGSVFVSDTLMLDLTERSYERNADDPGNIAEIGIASMRGGTIVGEHEIIFAGRDEVISLKHEAHSKSVFAVGSVNAAIFLAQKDAGIYDMSDMLK